MPASNKRYTSSSFVSDEIKHAQQKKYETRYRVKAGTLRARMEKLGVKLAPVDTWSRT